MVTRKVGELNKMMLSALKGKKGVKWAHVMSYLEENSLSVDNEKQVDLAFESPFSANTIPSDDLRRELWYDSSGDSLIRLALKGAPSRIIAALCHFCPEALSAADPNGRLPLHAACRYKVSEVGDKILQILVHASPASLIFRDAGGRTPLHYLFWYHASERTPEMVKLFCQKLPKSKFFKLKQEQSGDRRYPLPDIPRPASNSKVPANASIVADAKHGCLPIHYAVMQGARQSAIIELIQAYPEAKHLGDRYGRTVLHWYLGAELLEYEPLHVSGEVLPPGQGKWWESPLDVSLLELLISSRIARTADAKGRFPLHCACRLLAHSLFHCSSRGESSSNSILSIDAVKLIANHHNGQIGQIDSESRTPLMVLFDSFGKAQNDNWTEKLPDGAKVDPRCGGPPGFCPPVELIRLLLKHPDENYHINPAELEDSMGRLPIHAALEVAASEDVIEALIEAHPTCLLHTSEDTLSSPLHAAFRHPFTAPLQTTTIISLLLSSHSAGRHGYYLDGRLAMKMEDSEGNYPIHLACVNNACLDVIRLIVDKYPKAALLQKANFDLPVHCVIDEDIAKHLASPFNESKSLPDFDERLDVMRSKIRVLSEPLLMDPSKLAVAGRKMGMLPLHVILLFQAVEYPAILRMLELYPESGSMFSVDTVYSLSPLDFHEFAKSRWLGHEDDWRHIRELLFSYGCTLESHRHRQELLDGCVRIVIDEMSGRGSYHLSTCKRVEKAPNPYEDLSNARLDSSSAVSPRSSPARILRTLRPATVKEKLNKLKGPRLPPPPPPRQTESIYDEEDPGFFDYDETFSRSSDEEGRSDESSCSDSETDDYSSSSSVFSSSTEGDSSTDGGGMSTDDGPRSSYSHSSYSSGTIDGASTFETRESFASTLESINENGGFANPILSQSSLQTVEQVFDNAKRQAEEEKKDDGESMAKTPRLSNTQKTSSRSRPNRRTEKHLSGVGMRLWAFFVLYCDENNPSDTYVRQVRDIFDELGFSKVQKLVAIPLPWFSSLYLKDTLNSTELEKLSFEEVASPKCRELIRQTCYFVSRFEFGLDNSDSLVHLSSDNETVLVQAYDWTFTTEETKEAAKPGVSEAEIWSTGEVPAEVGTTFRSKRTLVWIKFTKNRTAYEREIFVHSKLSDLDSMPHVLPMVSHFNATATTRKEDRSYKVDTHDERFRTLALFSTKKPIGHGTVSLSDFPYAIVYSAPEFGSLSSFHRCHGVESIDDVRSTTREIAVAVRSLHENNIYHGNLTMDNIVLAHDRNQSSSASGQNWVLTNFSYGNVNSTETSYLGGVGVDSKPLFSTKILPPEMFAEVSPHGFQEYQRYWRGVTRRDGPVTQEDILSGVSDKVDGRTCTVKCYSLSDASEKNMKGSLPQLPYDLVEAGSSCDIWAFGLLLFELCAGRPLFEVNDRSGQLLDAGPLVSWDETSSSRYIYDSIQDPLAQDLLILLLSDQRSRESIDFERILQHPFFEPTSSGSTLVQSRRQTAASTYERNQRIALAEKRSNDWLGERTTPLVFWDLDILSRFYHSPTELTSSITSSKRIFAGPCSIVLLPYVFGDSTMDDPTTSLGCQLGELFISMSKSCTFAAAVKKVLDNDNSRKTSWSSSEILSKVELPEMGYGHLKALFAEIGSKYVESFRENPMKIAFKIIQSFIEQFCKLFEEDDAYLYLIDEYTTELIAPMAPFKIPVSRKNEVIRRALLPMQLSLLYCRGVAGSTEGISRSIYNGSIKETPPSWAEAAQGLQHILSPSQISCEIGMLQEALSLTDNSRHSIVEDLESVHALLAELDSDTSLRHLQRVTTAEMCLWVSPASLNNLKSLSTKISLCDVLQKGKIGS